MIIKNLVSISDTEIRISIQYTHIMALAVFDSVYKVAYQYIDTEAEP